MPKRYDDWDYPAIGEDPRLALPTRPQAVDEALRLARLFDAKWAEASQEHPELRVIRASNRGQAVGYVRAIMLAQNDLSPEHVAAYIEAFVAAVVKGDVTVRYSQMAFERFCDWWGRTLVADPSSPPVRRLVRKPRPS